MPFGNLAIVLKQGSRGPAVQKLQQYLVSATKIALALDGIFGIGTKAAVQAFQRARGLTADGVVGPATWLALSEALNMSLNITNADVASTTTSSPTPTPTETGGGDDPTPPSAGFTMTQKVGAGILLLTLGLIVAGVKLGPPKRPALAAYRSRHRR